MTSEEYKKMIRALDAVIAITLPYRDVIDLDIQKTKLKLARLQKELLRLATKYEKLEKQKN